MRLLFSFFWSIGFCILLLNGLGSSTAIAASNKQGQSAATQKSAKKPVVRTANRAKASRVKATTAQNRRTKSKSQPKAVVVPAKPSVAQAAGLHLEPDPLGLRSAAALIIDSKTNQILFEKNPKAVLPIASLTKLMTAIVVIDSKQDMNELLTVSAEDIDREKNSRSRLPTASVVSRRALMQLSLMASENRASSVLSRYFPGGKVAFVDAMNKKAEALGLSATQFSDASGLSPNNTSSVQDLVKLTQVADRYAMIREQSTAEELTIHNGVRSITFGNSNRLIKNASWDLQVQKTGFTSEAASCLILHGKVDGRAVTIALLGADGRLSKFGDAQRIREWLAK